MHGAWVHHVRDRVAEELMSERPDLDAVELQLRGDALAGSAALYQARLEAVDAALPAPECPKCVFFVDAKSHSTIIDFGW